MAKLEDALVALRSGRVITYETKPDRKHPNDYAPMFTIADLVSDKWEVE
ncbi:MAG TPA: hypothetical protein VI756_10405 [Blastocatellia bacterium]